MSFTHLHVHTQYSLLDGAARIPELVRRTKELGMDSVAITDHGVLYGIIDFYKACKKEDIKPIIGIEAYVTRSAFDSHEGVREYSHLILLAKNQAGLKNLYKLSSLAFTDGFYYKPRINYDYLEQYREGLICLSACLAGDIPSALLEGKDDEARELALRLKNAFGDDFYIEIQNHGLPEQLAVLPKLVALARECDIKLVATNDIHYIDRADAVYQDVLLCVQTNAYVDDEKRMRMSTDEFYLKSPHEMEVLFEQYPEAIKNTQEVADKCEVEFEFGARHMPVFTAPYGMDNKTYLRALCDEGMARRGFENNSAARERLEYELSVIESMGFSDYFLIVYDFIAFAKKNDIVIGPGRGSGVGSLVAYCLRITDVDPLKYNLLFERLLNPERVSMPDIDVDMCIERRQEVIDYVANKYGHDHVAQIATFGTLQAKAVLKDVARAMKMPPAYSDRLTSFVPRVIDITLKEAYADSPDFAKLIDSDPQAKKIFDYSQKLEGLPRHASTHAAGVVIAPEPLTEFLPLHVIRGAVSTQFAKDTVEELGLLKMDFLGLRTLTVIRYTLELIAANGKGTVDFETMEYDDKNVYEMISRGDTAAVFQLESAGMRQFMTKLKPECFEDIIAGISLYRPGPMDRIPDYIAGKFNRDAVTYADERLRKVLEPTYGVMVYQEQVMQIVRDLAGYSMGRSDLVRRAMAKKKLDVMKQERHNFIYGIEEDGKVLVAGALRNGVKKEVAEKIFDEMMDFASYAFNKSHAAAYAVVAYRTAYLKHYFPNEFMTAIINSFIGRSDKVAEYVYFCQSNGIKVLPPDINKSGVKFTTEGESIRIGLAAVKNVGESAMQQLIEERAAGGEFRDFSDFLSRNPEIGKRTLESLIKAGAFSSMSLKRSQLLSVYELALDRATRENNKRSGGQMLLFDMIEEEEPIAFPSIAEYDDVTLSAMEKETIGMYLTRHPLNDYSVQLKQMTLTAAELANADENSELDGTRVRMGCVIQSVSVRKTKAGALMARGILEDLSGMVEFLIFPAQLEALRSVVQNEAVLCVTGKVSLNAERGNAIIVEEAVELRTVEASAPPEKLFVRFESESDVRISAVRELVSHFPGNVPVIFYFVTENRKIMLPKELHINPSERFFAAMRAAAGDDNVKLIKK